MLVGETTNHYITTSLTPSLSDMTIEIYCDVSSKWEFIYVLCFHAKLLIHV
jgi:hypothetical protein